jgi:hypothetical protein
MVEVEGIKLAFDWLASGGGSRSRPVCQCAVMALVNGPRMRNEAPCHMVEVEERSEDWGAANW